MSESTTLVIPEVTLPPADLARLRSLEARVEVGLDGAADAADALKEIRDSDLWRAYGTFEEYALQRWGIGRTLLKNAMAAKPLRLEQRTIWQSRSGSGADDGPGIPFPDVPRTEDEDDLAELLARARAASPAAVAELARKREEQLLAEAAEIEARNAEEKDEDDLQRCRNRVRQALKIARRMSLDGVADLLAKAAEQLDRQEREGEESE